MEKNNNLDEGMIIFNIIAIGDSNVGKTAIVQRYMENEFNQTSLSTIGYIQTIKPLTMKDNVKIQLKITDTAGQEQYKSLASRCVKNISTVLFVFDLNNKKSFNNIKEWIRFFNDNANNIDIPKYLIGNKKDLEREVSQDMIDIFKDENNGFIYKETSAKEDNNEIKDLFEEIALNLYEMYKKNKVSEAKNKKVKLNKNDANEKCIC